VELPISYIFPSGQTLEVVQGDITQEKVDAIVNAANDRLQHGGGVAAIISRRAGKSVDDQSRAWVKTHGPVPHDQPAYTSGGNLPARFIIHAVGPIWGSGDETNKLAAAIRGSLQRAEELQLTSIAFPAISTGIFGFPKDRAARIFFQTLEEYFIQNPTSKLSLTRITLFDQPTIQAFSKEFNRHFHRVSASDWKILPLSKTRTPLNMQRTFAADEYRHLQAGFRPREMEDKWFIFFEENWLNFHRSWTGYCIFRLYIQPVGETYQIIEAWATRDPGQYTNTNPDFDIQTIIQLIDLFLLPLE
jgi:O-acetyl-ADP-ribose deacetylase (regulator of RNase III)